MSRYFLIGLVFFGLALGLSVSLIYAQQQSASEAALSPSPTTTPWWQFQSIDTMKYSRDPSGQVLNDPSFDTTIEKQVSDIAQTGATHVAIATPYDEQFIPVLKRWVAAARRHNLKVWFRGNFSGWEGWFGYSRIGRAEHLALTRAFLQKHPDLFEDGDLFSACPECENGGPGDPRMNGDAAGHRKFLIEEYALTREEFHKMGKNVQSNLHSMNGDVARLIMDEETTKALGGIVTIDHYVHTPEKLAKDIQDIAAKSKGKIILGEYGAPIPDIHGNLSAEQQAAWIENSLAQIAHLPELIGVNYWVSVGGSTRLWNDNGTPRPAVSVLTSYFKPPVVRGRIVSRHDEPIVNAKVSSATRTVYTDDAGYFMLPTRSSNETLTIEAKDYHSLTQSYTPTAEPVTITLVSAKPAWQQWLDNLGYFLRNLIS